MRTIFVLAAASAVLFGIAHAQTTAAAPQVLTDVYVCAQIQDGVQRLQCYDEAVGRLRQAETQGQIVAVDRSQAQELERDSFGFHLPSLSRLLPSLESGSQPIENMQMTVTSVRDRAADYRTFVMDNGQVWEDVEAQSARNVRVGDTVTIERAALGSFRLIPSRGGPRHRVRRQN
jgi:hypothetical protein